MQNQLKFNNGKFTILSLGDMHEKLDAADRHGMLATRDMHNLVEMGIKAFKPDLIVYMGDNCHVPEDESEYDVFREALQRLLKPVLESGIPFCYIMGNHEHDCGDLELYKKGFAEYEKCLAFNDPESVDDLSYNLLVKSSDGSEDVLNLWFIDSNNLAEDRALSKYDWVHPEQIAWYEKKAAEIKEAHGGKTLPAILFQHIPVYEEYELLREAKLTELPVSVEGHGTRSSKHYVLKDGVEGYLGEGPCTPCVNYGQFSSWKKTGDVKAAFFGHDHQNDFTGFVDGIMLGQNKTSGFRVYTDGCRSAVRVTTISEAEPDVIKSKVYHFKELGLTSYSLGPIMKRITDRQSINMHKASYAAAGLAGVIGAAKLIGKLKK